MSRDWEQCYRTGETPWDKGQAAPPLLEMIARLGHPIWNDGPVLVPGCGFGHDARALAALGIPVVGLDLSATAVEKARQLPAVGTETYEVGDFLDPLWRVGRRFSGIWEHTCFCAIHPSQRDAYAAAAAGVLDEGGILAGVFYLTPNDPGEESDGPPFESTIAELDERFSPWFERIEGWVPENSYPGREGKEWIGIFRKVRQDRVAD
jgi:SAM-dependent methyltransferase